MKRLILNLLLCTFLLLGAVTVLAQDTTPTPTTDEPPIERLMEAVERAEEAAKRAEDALSDIEVTAQRAEDAIDLAGNLFGLFEAMSGAIGIIVPFLAIAAGLLGFRRLENASNELKEARESFERDMMQRERELDILRDELTDSAQKQREDASKASLALSLLPLGEKQYLAQDYTGALDTYQRALRLDPNNPITHYRMGYVYTQSGELEKAEKLLTKSLDLDPEFAPAMAARGYVYRRMGDKLKTGNEQDIVYNKAEQNFLQALNAFPKLMDEDNESWWGSLGGLYRRRDQIDQAIRAYEQCSQVTPHSSYPFSNLALLYMQKHDRGRMLETYKRVEQLAWHEVQAEVDNYWAYADLIVARLALGKEEAVWEVLDTAIRTAPEDSPYTLESLLDTLNRLSDSLEPADRPRVEKVIAHIQEFKLQREARLSRAAETTSS